MKIGIVTTPLYANYGGILQNFALQKALRELGHEPVTLDYMPSLSFGHYLLYAAKACMTSLIPGKAKHIKPYRHFLTRPAVFKHFIDDNISHTGMVENYSTSLMKKNGIEALIVGSDQVWRYSYSKAHIDDMFLRFARNLDCRKLAYAASFGVEKLDYPADVTPRTGKLLSLFDAVSVRENSAATICKESFGVEARVVVDPTLLLTKEDYLPFCKKHEGHHYLAAYVLDNDEHKTAIINAFALSRHLEVKSMTVSEEGCSIEDWLSTIYNADYVITDSFHGSMFSILFEKQFSTFLNKGRGADRFFTIFDKLGLSDRIINEKDGILSVLGTIDYQSVNELLNSQRSAGIEFLRINLK